MKNLKGTEYADALVEALRMRRNGTITAELDNMLGQITYSIAHWSIGSMVAKGKLWKDLGNDPDVLSDVVLGVARYLDKVDLDRPSRSVLMYLKKAGDNAIKDMLRYRNAKKRQRDEVDLDSAVIETDFYGQRTGRTAIAINTEVRESV